MKQNFRSESGPPKNSPVVSFGLAHWLTLRIIRRIRKNRRKKSAKINSQFLQLPEEKIQFGGVILGMDCTIPADTLLPALFLLFIYFKVYNSPKHGFYIP